MRSTVVCRPTRALYKGAGCTTALPDPSKPYFYLERGVFGCGVNFFFFPPGGANFNGKQESAMELILSHFVYIFLQRDWSNCNCGGFLRSDMGTIKTRGKRKPWS